MQKTMVKKVQSNMKKSWKIIVCGDNDEYIKTKIKIYAGSKITNFQSKEIPKKATCKCLSIIILDSLIKAKKKYHHQKLLEEYKYEQEKIKMENLIDDDLQKGLSDQSSNESDDESNE